MSSRRLLGASFGDMQVLERGAALWRRDLPPTSSVFAAFLGYYPIAQLLGPGGACPPAPRPGGLPDRPLLLPDAATPFKDGLHEALDFAIAACLVAAASSWMIGKRYH